MMVRVTGLMFPTQKKNFDFSLVCKIIIKEGSS